MPYGKGTYGKKKGRPNFEYIKLALVEQSKKRSFKPNGFVKTWGYFYGLLIWGGYT